VLEGSGDGGGMRIRGKPGRLYTCTTITCQQIQYGLTRKLESGSLISYFLILDPFDKS